jgi:twitching motility protein PilT
MNLDLIRIDELIALARARRATDLHLGAHTPPRLRVDGRLTTIDVPPLSDDALAAFLGGFPAGAGPSRFSRTGNLDAARRKGHGAPYRLHAYRTDAGLRLAFRFLAESAPELEELRVPALLATLSLRPNGLILVTGPTGSGKTTAMAAVIDRINRTSERIVLTAEDPIEYLHASRRSLISHCEVGVDVPTYAEALRGFMRADPDVIFVGEMRDAETMEAALTAAETGHLVLSTLHTNDAAQTIDRIVDAFRSEAQAQVRTQLAATLLAVVSLRLVPATAGGRACAAEVMTGTDAVRSLIRDGKTHQLRNVIATGRSAGMQTLEMHLSDLASRGTISVDEARRAANHPAEIRDVARPVG